jgi:Zinc carboxypeptidase/Immune inhibitor A peptidase M6
MARVPVVQDGVSRGARSGTRLRVVVATALLGSALSVGSVRAEGQAGPSDTQGDRLELYSGDISVDQLMELRSSGFDIVGTEAGATPGTVAVEMVVSATDVADLEADGVEVDPVVDATGQKTADGASAEAAAGLSVWRSYSEPGGIRDEIVELAAAYPDLLKLVKIGTSVQGQDILALKLTKRANRVPDGRRPSVLYSSAQHAREWITVETNRRLLRHYLDNYGTDPEITKLVDRNELWFVLVANPDGYDYTFTEGNRLWRKNLADNNGDGVTTTADGVDPNRNWPAKWGYDNEGSSPDIGNATYRGPSPASEPETRALDGLMGLVGFEFQLNWHSAAELILYGTGWQVATPSPDDSVYVALAGDDANPAVAGYDSDISAELYTTNGETTEHAHSTYGTLAYTPELDTCDAAEAIFPDDAFGATYCEDGGRSVFEFPDDEALVQAVFDKNLQFALSMARSAADPSNPVSSIGLVAPDFVVDTFDTSYSGDQTVAVEAPRNAFLKRMHYRINGGRVRTTPVRLWEGGERYGGELDFLYGEYRGEVRNASAGDDVEVWFSAYEFDRSLQWFRPFRRTQSDPFTYSVAADSGAPVLILADEDYLGFGPQQPGVTSPRYAGVYGSALAANGVTYDTWDVSAQGAPHPLAVLDHYDMVIWEYGDKRLTQEASDVVTETFAGPFEDVSVAEVQQYTTIAVRDYLNEGGKLFQSGEYVGYFGEIGSDIGGAYYGLNGDPAADCVITESFFDDCLIYSDDFAQYYQGAFRRSGFSNATEVIGVPTPIGQARAALTPGVSPNSGGFLVTSEVLPPDQFPQFTSVKAAEYVAAGPLPFAPFSGEGYAAAEHSDESYMRLSTTVDLAAATSGSLGFKLSANTEGGYDHVLIEARPVGTETWTTLPDVGGATTSDVPADCSEGFFVELHPSLANYLTGGAPCTPTGATGAWNSITGSSGGWIDVEADLTGFAGQAIEVAISYVTDPGTGGIGVFVDDTVITVDGAVVDENDFETGAGAWTVPGPPAGSPGNATDWVIGPALFEVPAASVTTEDTVTFGFGFEAITSPFARARTMSAILGYLMTGGGSTADNGAPVVIG